MTTTAVGAPLLEVAGLTVRFRTRRGVVTALSGADLRLDRGGFGVVIGESGSGKSVLAHALLRMLPPNAEVGGAVRLGGRDVLGLPAAAMRAERSRRMAFIPQSPASALNPVRRVGAVMTEIARVRGLDGGGARDGLRAALATFGLDWDRVARLYPHQLSGGMQQRVVNAVALLGAPELVIADEPTSGLDADLVEVTALQLERIAATGAAVLVITHDLDLAERLGGRLTLLYASTVVEQCATDAFFAGPAHPYGRGLLAARPERGGEPIAGLPPELTALPDHCVFAERCPDRVAGCTVAPPAAVDVIDRPGTVRCVLHAHG